MKKTIVMILLLLLTSVWSIVCAGLQDKQSLVVVSSTEVSLCTPTLLPIADYEFEFPRTDTTTNLLLEYFDMLQCTTQQTNLLILPSFIAAEPTYDTICAGDTYTWNGNTYSRPGAYTDTLQNIHGCDSIVTLHLHVNPTYEIHDTIIACDSYLYNPFSKNGRCITIYKSGTYRDTATSISGCDSVFVLHLTINQSEIGTTEYATICYGETYTWNGNVYDTSDTYTLTLSNQQGCDSTATLVLTVLPKSVTQTENAIIGSDKLPYLWRGQSLYTTGQYTDTLYYAAAHCDSVIHVLNLTVLATGATDEQTATICDTELPYQWYNQEYTSTGQYTYTEKYAGTNIDSIQHILNLTINYRDTAFFAETACDSYEWHGNTYTTSGTYYYHTQTVLGCDSIEVLRLIILPPAKHLTFDTLLCHGVTCEWRNLQLTTAGTYNDTVKNQLDCDSVIYILNLEYLPDVVFVEEDTLLCHGVTCEWRNMQLTTAGTYKDTVKNQLACDSVIYILHLEYLPDVVFVEEDTLLCHGATCEWRGLELESAGTYNDTVKNQLDCDSVIYTLNLVIYPEIPITHVTDTMAGAEYHWNGQIYTDGGDYTVTLPAITGCDSVVILHLMDNPAAIDTVIVYEQCAGSGEQDIKILTQGFIEKIELRCSAAAQASGLRDTVVESPSTKDTYTIYYDSVRAGVHEVTAVGLFHGIEVATYTFALMYLYPNTIFEQRYNDLIAVLTHDYNGGYDFAAFQWYKDGVLLHGETHSYLNQPLTYNSEYSVLLTSTDGLQLMSCPIIAEDKAEVSVYPTLIKVGTSLVCRVSQPMQLCIYHTSGIMMKEYELNIGKNEIYMPAVSGVYLLLFSTENHIEHNVKVIVE